MRSVSIPTGDGPKLETDQLETQMYRSFVSGLVIITLSLGLPAFADDVPKRGGALTFMIPADSPPSFDGHREATFATIHAVAPFYSVLIRANPENPAAM